MTKFKVANIHCENCANTIKNALGDEYGEIKVDLSVEPRVVSVNLDGKKLGSSAIVNNLTNDAALLIIPKETEFIAKGEIVEVLKMV